MEPKTLEPIEIRSYQNDARHLPRFAALRDGAIIADFQNRHDAELFAAAPELLSNLVECIEWLESARMDKLKPNVKGIRTLAHGMKLIDSARSAVRKANGAE